MQSLSLNLDETINIVINFSMLLCNFFLYRIGKKGLNSWKAEKSWEHKFNFIRDILSSFYVCLVEMAHVRNTLKFIKVKIRPYIDSSCSDEYKGISIYIKKYGYSDNENLTINGLESLKSNLIKFFGIFMQGSVFNFENYNRIQQLYKQYQTEYMKIVDVASFLLQTDLDIDSKETRDYCKAFINEFLSHETEERIRKIGEDLLNELIKFQKYYMCD